MVANRSFLRQSGSSLIVALIILGMITVLSVLSFRVSDNSIAVTGNLQHAEAVAGAANAVIQEAISTVRLVESPDSVFANPCLGEANTRCVDINGDGTDDVTVRLDPDPTCVKVGVIPVNKLNLGLDGDRPCMIGVAQNFGVGGTRSSDSLCAQTVFEITAVARDAITEAGVTVVEGVGVRTSTDGVDTFCPVPGTAPG